MLFEMPLEDRAFRRIVEGFPAACILLQKGKVAFLNQWARAILGDAAGGLLGEDFLSLLHPEDRGEVEGSLASLHGPLGPIRARLKGAGGIDRWIGLMLSPVALDGQEGIILTFVDITEQKQMEERLREQVVMLSALYEGAEGFAKAEGEREVLQLLVKLCVEALGVKLAWLGEGKEDKSVKAITQWPPDHPYPGQIHVRWDETPEGKGPVGRCLKEGKAVVVQDILTDPSFAPWREVALGYGFRAVGAFPLVSRGRVWGSLVLYSDRPHFFTPEWLRLFEALVNQATASLGRVRSLQKAQKRLRMLESLRQVDLAIAASLDRRLTLRVILDEVMKVSGVEAAVLFTSAGGGAFQGEAIRGMEEGEWGFSMGEGILGKAALEGRVLQADSSSGALSSREKALLQALGLRFLLALPLQSKGKLFGVLGVFSQVPLDPEDREFLEVLAGQAGIALEDLDMIERLREGRLQLEMAYQKTLEGWAKALELRDFETKGHSERVTRLTVLLADRMGVRGEGREWMRIGALLHDVGKLAIPDSILLKPGELTLEEWKIMKRHPLYAFEMLKEIEFLRPALDIPLYHHERYDGKGYPKGLVGEEIPLGARIFAVVDAWDAMTNDRPYRKALRREEAIKEIKEGSGTYFDPKVVKAFLALLDQRVL